MPYDITEPINAIFSAIDNLRDIRELAGIPYTPQKMVDLGYIVVPKMPIF